MDPKIFAKLQANKNQRKNDKNDNNSQIIKRIEFLENNYKNIKDEMDDIKIQVKNLVEIIESILKIK